MRLRGLAGTFQMPEVKEPNPERVSELTEAEIEENRVHIAQESKWHPKREAWQGNVSDDEPHFGTLKPGHEVEVLVRKGRRKREVLDWIGGVVVAVDEDRRLAAVSLATDYAKKVAEIDMGHGFIRRPEDTRDMVSGEVAREAARARARNRPQDLVKLALRNRDVLDRSHCVQMLCRMSARDRVQKLMDQFEEWGDVNLTSVAARELGVMHARYRDIQAGLQLAEELQDHQAAQLTIEVLGVALNSSVRAWRRMLHEKFFATAEYCTDIKNLVKEIREALPRLHRYKDNVRSLSEQVKQQGLTGAFNELLVACGRASAVAEAFLVLEWMEALAIPKDNYTYEFVGFNVVKSTQMLARVWDLPLMPEEGPPEVVFAGRSNVGKSSLVNMLLSRKALAPTSARPGKTKTMDFYDVNHNMGGVALPRFRLVDVPGLGFARVSKDLRQRWVNLIGGYLAKRRSLKIVFHLLDAGLCEIMPADYDLWKLLAQANRTDLELCICLTKADHSTPVQMDRFARKVSEALRSEGSSITTSATIFACSSRSKLGKDTLWRRIYSVVEPEHVRQELRDIAPDTVEENFREWEEFPVGEAVLGDDEYHGDSGEDADVEKPFRRPAILEAMA